MYKYSVKVYNSFIGQVSIDVWADNRAQAMNIAAANGNTVLGCNFLEHD